MKLWSSETSFTYACLLCPELLPALQKPSLSAVDAGWENSVSSPGSYCNLPSSIDIPQNGFPEETRQLMGYGCHHRHLVAYRVTGFRAHMCTSTVGIGFDACKVLSARILPNLHPWAAFRRFTSAFPHSGLQQCLDPKHLKVFLSVGPGDMCRQKAVARLESCRHQGIEKMWWITCSYP